MLVLRVSTIQLVFEHRNGILPSGDLHSTLLWFDYLRPCGPLNCFALHQSFKTVALVALHCSSLFGGTDAACVGLLCHESLSSLKVQNAADDPPACRSAEGTLLAELADDCCNDRGIRRCGDICPGEAAHQSVPSVSLQACGAMRRAHAVPLVQHAPPRVLSTAGQNLVRSKPPGLGTQQPLPMPR